MTFRQFWQIGYSQRIRIVVSETKEAVREEKRSQSFVHALAQNRNGFIYL